MFKVGDAVRWTSMGKLKVGVVVEVVAAHKVVPYRFKINAAGSPRPHDSYVIKAGSLYYWPRVKDLLQVQP